MTFAGIREPGEEDSEKAGYNCCPWCAVQVVCGNKSIIQAIYAGHTHNFFSTGQNKVGFGVLRICLAHNPVPAFSMVYSLNELVV